MNSSENKKLIFIFIGPPGSGKGTQAEMLAKKFGLFNFETSKIIEEKINAADSNDEIMMREKAFWISGELNTPEFVEKWVIEKVNEIYKNGEGIIFSGSPRTIKEAQAEMPVLEELYGRNNIRVILINLSREESFKRNSHRRICEANRHPIPNFPEFQNLTTCPKDGSRLIVRKGLDDPEIVKERYNVYQNRTEPVLAFLREKDYNIIEIDGEQPIDNVFKEILNKI